MNEPVGAWAIGSRVQMGLRGATDAAGLREEKGELGQCLLLGLREEKDKVGQEGREAS